MKRSTRRFFVLTILVAVFSFAASNCFAVTTIKAGHVLATGSPYHMGMVKFGELVKTKTEGRYVIEIYPNGQIGSERDLIEGVQLGSVGMAIVASGPVSNFAPELAVVDLPFLFTGYEHADRVFKGNVGKYLAERVDEAGLKCLGFWENGFRDLTNSKHPVKSVSDVKGLKIRTMENAMHQALWKALGADPVPMAWGDAYTAMQQGAIDGQENPLPIILAMKVSEVNEYLAITEHVYAPAVLIINDRIWKKMSDTDKAAFNEAFKEAGDYERAVNRQQVSEAISKLESQSMQVTYPDKKEFRAATAGIKQKLASQFGNLVSRIEAEE